MLRAAIFLIGLAFMLVGCTTPFFVSDDRLSRVRLFEFGLLLALGAHGWPDGLR